MTWKKTLLTCLTAGIIGTGIGYSQANAQDVYSKINPDNNLKNKIEELAKRDSLVITKEQYEKLSASQKARISPLYFGSRDGKKMVPMYALPGFYEALSSNDHLFLKRAAQKPIGYFISDNAKERKPVYLIKEGGSAYYYIGPAEKVAGEKIIGKKIENKTKQEKERVHASKYAPKPAATPGEKPGEKIREDNEYLERVSEFERKMFERLEKSKPNQDRDVAKIPLSGTKNDKRKAIVLKEKSIIADKSEKKAGELETMVRFGLEAGYGTNRECVTGAFLDIPINSWMDFELFSDYYAKKGQPLSYEEEIVITEREKELIGPATYKQRTDEIQIITEQKAIADAGAGLTLKVGKRVEFPIKIGANFARHEQNVNGKSTIIFERNAKQLGDVNVITNSKEPEKCTKANLMWGVGTRFNLTDNLSAEFSYNIIGEISSGRLNVRVGF